VKIRENGIYFLIFSVIFMLDFITLKRYTLKQQNLQIYIKGEKKDET